MAIIITMGIVTIGIITMGIITMLIITVVLLIIGQTSSHSWFVPMADPLCREWQEVGGGAEVQ